MKSPERHDILTLSAYGRSEILKNVAVLSTEVKEALLRYTDLPVIYTGRSDADTGRLNVGISFPERICGVRIRAASSVDPERISSVTDPWSVPEWQIKDNKRLNLILYIKRCAAEFGIDTGIFGGAAMEAVTGYDYLHENSDIDIIFRNITGNALLPFAGILLNAERQSGIRIDAEVRVPGLYPEKKREGYVRLRELVSSQSTVIVKGCGNAYIAGRLEVIEHL